MAKQGKKIGGDKIREKIEKALDSIRPALQAVGVNIELISVEDGSVRVKTSDACGGSPISQVTLTEDVEKVIKKAVPEIKEVITINNTINNIINSWLTRGIRK